MNKDNNNIKKWINRLGLNATDFSRAFTGKTLNRVPVDDTYYAACADDPPIISLYSRIIEGGSDTIKKIVFRNIDTAVDMVVRCESYELHPDYEVLDEEIQWFLGEDTYKDLRLRAPGFLNVRGKSKAATQVPRYKGTVDDVVNWEIESYTTPGVVYQQQVKLLELNDMISNRDGSKRPVDIVRKALQGDIEVHCTDPSWKYWGFQYIGTMDRYAIEPETLSPDVRNPKKQGSICKHLDAVLLVLPFWSGRITQDLQKAKRFN